MNIIQYDTATCTIEQIGEIYNYLKDKEFECVFIPKDFTVLLDVDSATLHHLRREIDEAIRQKEIINNM